MLYYKMVCVTRPYLWHLHFSGTYRDRWALYASTPRTDIFVFSTPVSSSIWFSYLFETFQLFSFYEHDFIRSLLYALDLKGNFFGVSCILFKVWNIELSDFSMLLWYTMILNWSKRVLLPPDFILNSKRIRIGCLG